MRGELDDATPIDDQDRAESYVDDGYEDGYDDADDGYRPLNGLAVVSGLLGLASPLALAHPAAWTIPAVAVAIGLLAFRRAAQDTLVAGTWCAAVGIILGGFFVAVAPCKMVAERSMLRAQANQYVEEWLQAIIDRDLDKAYQAVLVLRNRQPHGTLLDEHYASDVDAAVDRDNYFAAAVPRKLIDVGTEVYVRHDRDLALYRRDGEWFINQRHYLCRQSDDQPVFHLQSEVVWSRDEDGVLLRIIAIADAEERDQMIAPSNWRR